ncbi:MAG: GNAT family N-acetyltransferase [Chloroflexi bacterium]|nr:GNAT family N-acetyltransferase [Chloroflexota bacterium]
MNIRPIVLQHDEVTHVAQLLVDGFADISSAWPDRDAAREEVLMFSTETQISLVALCNDYICGWISATPQYQQMGWELHPLVVAPHMQRQGVGRALIEALCHELAQRGATSLFAWSDDEGGFTSLGAVNLLPNPLAHLTTFTSSEHHAAGFYLKMQFHLCGVLPNANGMGKPDILFVRAIQ